VDRVATGRGAHGDGQPVTPSPGDGWVHCDLGHRHWGRCGAAGVLVHRAGTSPAGDLLLQHRAEWSHHGGTWGLLGGARLPGEAPVDAALREAAEESGLRPAALAVHGTYVDDHGGWSYTTVVASAVGPVDARAAGHESLDVAWWPADRLGEVPLHPGFAESWPRLRTATTPVTVVVDAANVVGSRPDGWWKDRAGATRRLVADVARLAAHGVPDTDLPKTLDRAPLHHWWPRWLVVVEGSARSAVDGTGSGSTVGRVEVVAAPGSGDDAVVAALAAQQTARLVVTADRELRDRCTAQGAEAVGPRWLLDLLDRPPQAPSG